MLFVQISWLAPKIETHRDGKIMEIWKSLLSDVKAEDYDGNPELDGEKFG